MITNGNGRMPAPQLLWMVSSLGALHIKTRPIAEKVSILNCSQTFLGRYHNITSNYGKAWAKNMVKSISNIETSIVGLIILNGNGEGDELSL